MNYFGERIISLRHHFAISSVYPFVKLLVPGLKRARHHPSFGAACTTRHNIVELYHLNLTLFRKEVIIVINEVSVEGNNFAVFWKVFIHGFIVPV